VGDRVVAVDGLDASAMTRGEVISALHGRPGERRRLTLARGGRTFEVDAVVSAY
jgi:C-terminal processing protease CtpA/Prc